MRRQYQAQDREIRAHIVDNNGEIIDTIYAGDRIARCDAVYHNFNNGKGFIKLYQGAIDVMRTHLSLKEFMIALALANFVCYQDCCLRQGGHGSGKPMTIQSIADALNENYNTIRENIRSLKQKQVLGVFETGDKKFITVNPWIYTKGTDVNKTVIAYFKDSLWANII